MNALPRHLVADRRVPDAALLDSIAVGNRAALLELRARYSTTAYAVAYGVVTDPELADEAVTRVFERVWIEAGGADRHRGSTARWIAELTRAEAGLVRRSA